MTPSDADPPGRAPKLAFPAAEYAARVNTARRRMHAADLDALLVVVITVEPSAATADGLFHHEPDVLVTEARAEVLSTAPVELDEVR